MNSLTKHKIKQISQKIPVIQSTMIFFKYLYFRYLKNKRIKNFYLSPSVKINRVNQTKKTQTFFGYYNISPFNSKENILFGEVDTNQKRGSLHKAINLQMTSDRKIPLPLGQSKAWNWQQGCMLQWLPGQENLIIYNDYDDITDQYISKVVDTEGKLIRTYNIPINNVSKTGEYALSLNYDRLAKMRPDYGYFNRKNNELIADDNDGIWYLDLKNGKTELIVTLEQLKNLSPSDTMEGALHKVNHIDINPSGTRFMFLHRWVGPKGRFMRLITANPNGTELFILNGNKMTSHSCWVNDKDIISFCYVPDRGNGYYRFIDQTADISLVSEKLPEEDGHSSVGPNGRWMITDTYPDKARMSWLILYDLQNDCLFKIGRFYQPLKYMGEMRIDLHPKWGVDGNRIFIESGHEGRRCLYSIDVSGIVNK